MNTTNERPTQETDAAERMAFTQEYMVPTAFARRLERERDKATENATNYFARLGEVERERDEAREQLRLANIDCYAALTELDAAREPLGFFDATHAFIDAALLHYANHSSKDLNQVFMWGPFTGWSERQVVELIKHLDEGRNLHRLEP